MGQHRRLLARNRYQLGGTAAGVALLTLAFAAGLFAPGSATALTLRHATSAEFTIPASNGYTLDVKSEDGRLTLLAFREASPVARISGPDQLLPPGEGGYSAATYYAPATGDPEAIDADLGALGEVHVSFQPSGQTRVAHLDLSDKRKGCNAPRRIVRRLGTFVGRIAFHGENGYTAADLTSASGSVGTSPYRTCSTKPHSRSREIVTGQAGPDAFLNVSDAAAHVSFWASTLGSGVGFYASFVEMLPSSIAVVRTAHAAAHGNAFGLDPGRHAATLRPPAPFSGGATYSSPAGAPPNWNGSLAVAFPGRTIALAGSSFKARLRFAK